MVADGHAGHERPSRITLTLRITMSCGMAAAVGGSPTTAAVVIMLAPPMLIAVSSPVATEPISRGG